MSGMPVREEQIMRKVMRRIVPFLLVGCVVSCLDRINVDFAALQMSRDIGLKPAQFGWGAGLGAPGSR